MTFLTAIRYLRGTAHGGGDVEEAVKRVLTRCSSELRPCIIRYVYWHIEECDVSALIQATGSLATMLRTAGEGPVIGTCARCGRVQRAHERETLPWQMGCPSCVKNDEQCLRSAYV